MPDPVDEPPNDRRRFSIVAFRVNPIIDFRVAGGPLVVTLHVASNSRPSCNGVVIGITVTGMVGVEYVKLLNTSPPTMQLKPLAVYVAIGAEEGQMLDADADPASRTPEAIKNTCRII